jgi:hypothetical protein
MKNTIIFFSSIIFFSLVFSGCRKDAGNLSNFSEVVDFSAPEELQKLKATNGLGIYTGSFLLHEGNVYIVGTTTNSLTGLHKDARISIWFFRDLINQEPFWEAGDVFINDYSFKLDGTRYAAEELDSQESIIQFLENEIVGKDIKIRNIRGEEPVFEEAFYVPERIILNGTDEYSISGTAFMKMRRDNFILNYNYDEQNQNGLLITLYYRGEHYPVTLEDFENLDPSNNVTRAIHIKAESPTGTMTIPPSFFDDIPDNGLVTMYVKRGNARVFSKQGKEYSVRAATEQQIRVVLE